MLKLPTGPIMLSRDEFKEVLYTIRGAKPVTITARTEPDLIGGKKCPLCGLVKVSVVNGMIGTIYENAVNRVRVKEDGEDAEPFIAGPRRWGSRLFTDEQRRVPLVIKAKQDNPYFTFDDIRRTSSTELYLEVQVKRSLGHKYELNGDVVTDEVVSPHLRPRGDFEVILRDYALASIEQATLDDETFILGNEVTLPQLLESHKVKGKHVAV